MIHTTNSDQTEIEDQTATEIETTVLTPPQEAIRAAGERFVFEDEAIARQIYDEALQKGWGFRGALAVLFGTAYEWGKLETNHN